MSDEARTCVYAPFLDCEGDVTLYPHGGKCERHRPPAPPIPDPARTLTALRAAAARDRAELHTWHLDFTEGESNARPDDR